MGKIGDIKVGYSCNNDCMHCVVAHKRKEGDKTLERVKQDIGLAFGACSHLILTGGEPTIRKDFLQILEYAKRNFKEITIQTNGRMFSYEKFTKKVMQATKTIKVFFVVAVHGDSKEIHDAVTRVAGSFEQTVKGIENLEKMKSNVKIQTVITKLNYRHLPKIVKLFSEKGIKKIQFPFVHPAGNAFKYSEKIVPKMSKVIPYVKSAIDLAKKMGVEIKTEGIPPCCLKENQECISEFSRKIEIEMNCPEEVNQNFDHIGVNYSKTKKCSGCSMNNLCAGTWKEYFELYGDGEFKVI
jgi:MoaA/NifB/PqqE/SkfB family radical SAM enzyme